MSVTVELTMDADLYAFAQVVAGMHNATLETFIARAIVRHALAILDDNSLTPPEVSELLELGVEGRRN